MIALSLRYQYHNIYNTNIYTNIQKEKLSLQCNCSPPKNSLLNYLLEKLMNSFSCNITSTNSVIKSMNSILIKLEMVILTKKECTRLKKLSIV